MTGSMNTCMKYILVTVAPESDVPPNRSVAAWGPISGVAAAMFIPIVAAPNAKASQGKR